MNKTRRQLLADLRQDYETAYRKKRSQLLNGIVTATGYNRKYAISLLNSCPSDSPAKRNRRKVYDSDVADALKQIWIAANCICPKRLVPFLPSLLESMERFGHLKLDESVREKLLCMSSSTAERLIRAEQNRKGRSLTRPGSLLRVQMPVKTFTKWDGDKPGFFEIDLVAHCGKDTSGRFLNTLTITDIATGWTELGAVLYRNEDLVRIALDDLVSVLPFRMRGIDTDNGGEFLNHGMISWCNARRITFTRSRAHHKNDQAHVEEKNGSIVRRLIGYDRFEGNKSRECLEELYRVTRLYINYFQSSMKLINKTSVGARVRKLYDEARTPLERLLTFRSVPRRIRNELLNEFTNLDPVALLAEMATLQKKFWRLVVPGSGSVMENKTPPTEPGSFPVIERRRRRSREKSEHTPTSKIFEIIFSLPLGAPVAAKDFYQFGTIHFVNVTLQRILERDRILARPAWGKYVRIAPKEAKRFRTKCAN